MTFFELLKKPGAILPLAMSLAAFALIIAVLLTVGITQPEDEGAPARIFQLLMLLQVPAIAFFAAKWLPRCPRPVILVLLLQVGLALSAVAVVILLESGVFF